MSADMAKTFLVRSIKPDRVTYGMGETEPEAWNAYTIHGGRVADAEVLIITAPTETSWGLDECGRVEHVSGPRITAIEKL